MPRAAARALAVAFRAVACRHAWRSREPARGTAEAQRWAAPQPETPMPNRNESNPDLQPLGSQRGKTVDPKRRHRVIIVYKSARKEPVWKEISIYQVIIVYKGARKEHV